MKHIRIILLLLIASTLFACFFIPEKKKLELELFCVEPTEVSVHAMELYGLNYPSSPLEIAQDLADPLDNLHHYGIKVRTTLNIKNVSGGTIYLDSVELEMARENGADPSNMKMKLDSAITLADSAETSLEWVGKVNAKNMNLQFMKDLLLAETVNLVQTTPKLFIRFDDSHICQESEAFVDIMLGEAAEMAFTATAVTVEWIVTHPRDTMKIILTFIGIALKMA